MEREFQNDNCCNTLNKNSCKIYEPSVERENLEELIYSGNLHQVHLDKA